MSRAGTVAFAVLAAALVVAVLGLTFEVHRAPVAAAHIAAPPTVTHVIASRASATPASGRPSPVGPGPVQGSHDVSPPGAANPPQLPTIQVARAEREKVLAGLRDSGNGAEPWDDTGSALFEEIGRRAAHSDPLGCFVAGCGATFTFASAADFERERAEIETLPAYKAWTGGKRWTTPDPQPDGAVVVALALYRPD